MKKKKMQEKKVRLNNLQSNHFLNFINLIKGVFINFLNNLCVYINLINITICCFWFSNAFAQEKIFGHGGPIKGLTISSSGYLVSSSFDYTSIIWSLNDLSQLHSINDHFAAVNVAKFSPDENTLITASDDTRVLVYNLNEFDRNNSQVSGRELGKHSGKVSDVVFSKDGKLLATAGWGGFIMVWNMIDQTLIFKTTAGHRGPINTVQFSNDGKYLYSAGYDGTIRKFEILNQASKGVIISNGWGVNVLYVDEINKLIVYGTTDGAIVTYDINKREEILRIVDERVPVLSIAQNKEGSLIALGNSKGRVIILDILNNSLVRDFRAAYGPVWAMALNDKATMLFVGGLDDYINQWNLIAFPQPVIVPPGPARRFNPSKLVSNGERQFARKCSVCHTLEVDGKSRAGPTLYKVFGRKAGGLKNYKYSNALIESEIIWNKKSIHKLFTEGPDVVLPGTKMPIQRMKSSKDRIDLIDFLKVASE